MKILVINPFATDRYDEVVRGVCERAKRPDTHIDVKHIDRGLPYIRYRYFQALIVPEIVELCICAEKDGFDGVFVSCCFEPGVQQAREVVDIPVVGGSAPPVFIARQLGHRFGFITDTRQADVITRELFNSQRLDTLCVGIRSIELGVEQIQENRSISQERVLEVIQKLVDEGADTVILGCTILSANFDYTNVPAALADIPIIDANVAALKTLESLVDLRQKNNIGVSRRIYSKPETLEPSSYSHIRRQSALPQ